MNLASDGDKTVVKNDVPSTTAKAESVTVLEARRYLGLAPTSNAAAVTNQIASNPEWARALQPSAATSTPVAQAATGKVLNTLKIQMHPIDLGTVTATLRLKDDELHVEIKVETGDAFRQLSDDQNAMVKALRAQGFAVDQVNIVFNASDSSTSNTAQQQAQPQAGQQGREALGDGTGQGKGQRNDNGSQQQGRERWTGNEGTSDASSGAELNRAGDVYM
jgi:chemotaxis protein MotD